MIPLLRLKGLDHLGTTLSIVESFDVSGLTVLCRERKVRILGEDFEQGLREHSGLERKALPSFLGGGEGFAETFIQACDVCPSLGCSAGLMLTAEDCKSEKANSWPFFIVCVLDDVHVLCEPFE